MLSYDDKRDFYRMSLDCPVHYSVNGQEHKLQGIVKDISASGVLMWLQETVSADDVLDIKVSPVKDITPPLAAEVRVIRCSPIEGVRGTFAVACETIKIHP